MYIYRQYTHTYMYTYVDVYCIYKKILNLGSNGSICVYSTHCVCTLLTVSPYSVYVHILYMTEARCYIRHDSPVYVRKAYKYMGEFSCREGKYPHAHNLHYFNPLFGRLTARHTQVAADMWLTSSIIKIF
jgi:hypothetical protein